jgi:hypothetical protein
MEIYHFKEVNTIIAENQPPYKPTPALKIENSDNGQIVICWKLSFREKIRLLFTGKNMDFNFNFWY